MHGDAVICVLWDSLLIRRLNLSRNAIISKKMRAILDCYRSCSSLKVKNEFSSQYDVDLAAHASSANLGCARKEGLQEESAYRGRETLTGQMYRR